MKIGHLTLKKDDFWAKLLNKFGKSENLENHALICVDYYSAIYSIRGIGVSAYFCNLCNFAF